jgi:nucleoside-diphosphate-sugar epimerase
MFYGHDVPSTQGMIDMVRKRRLPVIRDDAGALPFIHVDDAVSATVRALTQGPSGATYDIVDDRAVSMSEFTRALAEYTGSAAPLRVPGWLPRLVAPYLANLLSVRLPLSNAKARAELGWRPEYPNVRAGLAQILRQAA